MNGIVIDMEAAWQFLQNYGPLLVLGGAVVFLMTRRGGCCGAGASCQRTPATGADAAPAQRGATPTELRAQLAALRAQQEEIASRIAALEADAPERQPAGQTSRR